MQAIGRQRASVRDKSTSPLGTRGEENSKNCALPLEQNIDNYQQQKGLNNCQDFRAKLPKITKPSRDNSEDMIIENIPTYAGSAPRVYSYLRFSRPEQALGDSARRQIEKAKAYAHTHGLIFDEQLCDHGVSAFRGAHRKKGNLGRFLARVAAGEIPQGSVLFVEEIDRLSREEIVEAMDMFIQLVQAGISIATPDFTYDRESLSNGAMWRLLGKLSCSNDESRKKEDRGRSVWVGKRVRMRQGVAETKRAPAWLTKNGKIFELIPEAADAIRMIFDLTLKMGRVRLVLKLNKSAPWMPPGRKKQPSAWRMSYVRKILDNRAVLGEFQPHRMVNGKRVPEGAPILNYFPRVIDDRLFRAVQARINENRGKGGRTGKARNVLQHLVKCAYCGGSMIFVDKGRGHKWQYLACDNGKRGVHEHGRPKCTAFKVRYEECADSVLENCRKLQPDVVLPNPKERTRACEGLRQRISAAASEAEEIAQTLKTAADRWISVKNIELQTEIERQIDARTRRRAALLEEIDKLRHDLAAAESSLHSMKSWQADLAKLKAIIGREDAVEERMRLQHHLRSFIAKIEVFAVGYASAGAEITPQQKHEGANPLRPRKATTDTIGEHLHDLVAENWPEMARQKKFRLFVKHVLARRMSEEGRFFRVHFKAGAIIDVVPPGSIASGKVQSAAGGEWEAGSPSVDDLASEFTAKTGIELLDAEPQQPGTE